MTGAAGRLPEGVAALALVAALSCGARNSLLIDGTGGAPGASASSTTASSSGSVSTSSSTAASTSSSTASSSSTVSSSGGPIGDGAILWQHTLPAWIFGLVTDAAGSIYVGGWASDGADFGDGVVLSDAGPWFLLKLTPGGKAVWARTLPFAGAAAGNSRALTTDGTHVYYGGDTSTVGAFVSKVDADGNILWSRTGGASVMLDAARVAPGGQGSVYVATNNGGNAFGSGIPSSGGDVLLKLDAGGNILWAKGYSTSIFDMMVDAEGRLLIVSSTFDSGGADFGCPNPLQSGFLVTLDGLGNCVWSRDQLQVSLGALAADAAGEYLAMGMSGPTDFGGGLVTPTDYELGLASYGASGAYRWNVLAGGAADSYPSIAAGPGGLAVFLRTSVPLTFNGATLSGTPETFAIMRFGDDGAPHWARSSAGEGSAANIVTVDPSGNVIAAGASDIAVDFGAGPLLDPGGLKGFILKMAP